MLKFKKLTVSEKIFYILCYLLVSLYAVATFLPFVNILALSFSGRHAVLSGKVSLIPKDLTLDSYKFIIQQGTLPNALKNSIIVTLVGTLISIVTTIPFAYALSKKRVMGAKAFLIMVIITIMFNPGIIPNYLLIKNLGLINKWWALWLSRAVHPFNAIIMTNFFRSLPKELEESVQIDGGNDFVILTKIVIPSSMASIATVTLLYAVSHWNLFFQPMMYLTDPQKYTLPLRLREIIAMGNIDQYLTDAMMDQSEVPVEETIKSAAIIFSTIPILLIYPLLQKHFVKGVLIGSIKG